MDKRSSYSQEKNLHIGLKDLDVTECYIFFQICGNPESRILFNCNMAKLKSVN